MIPARGTLEQIIAEYEWYLTCFPQKWRMEDDELVWVDGVGRPYLSGASQNPGDDYRVTICSCLNTYRFWEISLNSSYAIDPANHDWRGTNLQRILSLHQRWRIWKAVRKWEKVYGRHNVELLPIDKVNL